MDIQAVKMIKKILLPVVLLVGSFITLPAYAWPDVDHMNMCGAPAKLVRSYGGSFKGWTEHDNYITKRGRDYYFKTMCPDTKASKNYKQKTKVIAKKKKAVRKSTKRIAKSTIAKSFKRKVKYDEKADCKRVDNMNSSGAVVRVVRRR